MPAEHEARFGPKNGGRSLQYSERRHRNFDFGARRLSRDSSAGTAGSVLVKTVDVQSVAVAAFDPEYQQVTGGI